MAQRILIVDDDMYIRDLYEEILKNERYDVTIAQDGAEGLTYLQQGGFDVVLLDVMMPKLDGVGVLTKIKEFPPAKPNGPILLLTNLDHDPILDEAKKLGARDHILKADILPPMLVEIVKKNLESNPTEPLPPVQ